MGSKVVSLDSDERFQRQVNRQMAEVSDQNERLVNALREAREQIAALKEEVDKLCARPRPTASTSPPTRTIPSPSCPRAAR